MTSGQETLLAFAVIAAAAGAAYGWFSDKSKRIKEDELNRDLRKKLEAERQVHEQCAAARTSEIETREAYLGKLREKFTSGVLPGRRWLANFIAEADRALDESISERLRDKKRPAYKAAEEVAEARAERRQFKERAKFLEYQLLSLKEYFPFLEEYEDIILDESIPLTPGESNLAALEESDPVLRFVAKADYDRLSTAERNQLALDRYFNGTLGPAAIGRLYERYLGYLYECDGWQVEYHGIVKGLEDLGRDLICSKGNASRSSKQSAGPKRRPSTRSTFSSSSELPSSILWIKAKPGSSHRRCPPASSLRRRSAPLPARPQSG